MATVSSSNSNSTIINGGISSVTHGQWKAKEAIGRNARALQALRELIVVPLLHSREAQKLGLKTSLVRAIVRESDAHLIVLSPSSDYRAHAAESENLAGCVFRDALCPRHNSRCEQDVRLASQLITLMETLSNFCTTSCRGLHQLIGWMPNEEGQSVLMMKLKLPHLMKKKGFKFSSFIQKRFLWILVLTSKL
ncbi:Cell division control protein 48 homolog B [Gossypium arboreum]|uniref:Cell division control protein 48 homolog B n=2 Tax=Gossypium arboreum TaxID=29729 RepID=A0A0B0MEL7_GOSAR|nr:Cell division control protein 48 homolog B [Gossypium arboreum]